MNALVETHSADEIDRALEVGAGHRRRQRAQPEHVRTRSGPVRQPRRPHPVRRHPGRRVRGEVRGRRRPLPSRRRRCRARRRGARHRRPGAAPSRSSWRCDDRTCVRSASGPYFGQYGGRFVPESLVAALDELTRRVRGGQARTPAFQAELARLHATYTGRPSPITEVPRFAQHAGGARIFLKREDLNHTGSHKINNVLGQALLTRRIGKTRVIAETGAGQHGVATATAAALFGLDCVIYMGEVDTRAPGAQRRPDAPARRRGGPGDDRVAHPQGRDQRGDARLGHQRRDHQLHLRHGRRPASVPGHGARLPEDHRRGGPRAGARSSPAGCPTPSPRASAAAPTRSASSTRSSTTTDVALYGFEAAGDGVDTPRHAATITKGRPGVLHGARSYLLQDEDGQTIESHSISAGLDYPGVGPEHAWLADIGRASYLPITDAAAMDALRLLSRTEGIIPAIESAHALAGVLELGKQLGPGRDHPGEPQRPRRQGHGDRGTLLRHPRRECVAVVSRHQPGRGRDRRPQRRGRRRLRRLPPGRLPRPGRRASTPRSRSSRTASTCSNSGCRTPTR